MSSPNPPPNPRKRFKRAMKKLGEITDKVIKESAKETEPEPDPREPTKAWWVHEDWVRRRTNWMWKLAPWIKARSEQCKICKFQEICHRIPCNEKITGEILAGKECPDFKSLWEKILNPEEEEHDWGF